ncbi:unnamed protein product, partial [Urochloa humidicola]
AVSYDAVFKLVGEHQEQEQVRLEAPAQGRKGPRPC